MSGTIIRGLWLAWGLLWLLLARTASPALRREGAASRAAHLLPLALSGLLLAAPALLRRLGLGALDRAVLPWHPAFGPAGAALVAAGLAFSAWARLHLGAQWSGTVTLKHDHRLVRTGPYRRVRHPIYTGMLLALAGTALATDAWRGVLALLLASLALLRKLRTEERLMHEAFGPQYAEYRRSSGALLPRAGAP